MATATEVLRKFYSKLTPGVIKAISESGQEEFEDSDEEYSALLTPNQIVSLLITRFTDEDEDEDEDKDKTGKIVTYLNDVFRKEKVGILDEQESGILREYFQTIKNNPDLTQYSLEQQLQFIIPKEKSSKPKPLISDAKDLQDASIVTPSKQKKPLYLLAGTIATLFIASLALTLVLAPSVFFLPAALLSLGLLAATGIAALINGGWGMKAAGALGMGIAAVGAAAVFGASVFVAPLVLSLASLGLAAALIGTMLYKAYNALAGDDGGASLSATAAATAVSNESLVGGYSPNMLPVPTSKSSLSQNSQPPTPTGQHSRTGSETSDSSQTNMNPGYNPRLNLDQNASQTKGATTTSTSTTTLKPGDT